MNTSFLKDTLGWGFILWLFGYILGIIFFAFLPPNILGWAIMPFGIAFTLWVLFKKIKSDSLKYYIILAASWTAIAVIFDFLFLVLVFKPADGYYKLDVYIYYILMYLIPVCVGRIKTKNP